MKINDFIDKSSIYWGLRDLDIFDNTKEHRELSADDIIEVCKRKNNSKRDFLFVNKYQGKHIPVEYDDLYWFLAAYASKAKQVITDGKKTCVIGFAETATMLGDFTADYNTCYFRQTTREEVFDFMSDDEREKYTRINFAEEHSHATAQYFYLLKENDKISKMDTIIICEDEITTGKTVINLITKLRPYLKEDCEIYVMSVLNWQTEESLKKFAEYGITPIYLMKGTLPEDMHFDGVLKEKEPCRDYIYDVEDRQYFIYSRALQSLKDKVLNGTDYITAEYSANRIMSSGYAVDEIVADKGWKKVCVLGTEEYMYPAFDIARALYFRVSEDDIEAGDFREVYFHASTRSPITIAEDTAIYKGYEFYSAGDMNVKNYLYDFDVNDYDGVIVVIGNDKNVDKMNTVDNLIPHNKLVYVCASNN